MPAGWYLTGPIDLVSNMTLHLDEGAVIMFSDDPEEYPPVETRWEGIMRQARRPLLWANGCTNVAITGSGIIDGQGARWWESIQRMRRQRQSSPATPPPTPDDALRRRPPLAQFRDCRRVRIEGVTFQNSPFWTLHLLFSDDIVVRNCRFLAPEDAPNTDAMDIDSCRRVLVEDCHADVGDDAFTLKSGRDEDGRRVARPTERVTIRGCTVKRAHGGVVIGSEMSGDVRNIRFENCDFEGTDTGVRIKTMRGRGGVVENVRVNNIRMKDVINSFHITMRYRFTEPEPVSQRTPRVRDIRIRNIIARDSRRAGVIDGLEERPIEDVAFENLDITAAEPLTISDARSIRLRRVRIAADALPALKTWRVGDVKLQSWCESLRAAGTQPAASGGGAAQH
ncbi:glycoside hydrolase family 28 protein [Fontivita pretiosa]|uniref:glycoside hydrolase family 28 protein n=1 Tax=Fontivita pretiosa TaxID=2989684 RepID=UPI003D1774AD